MKRQLTRELLKELDDELKTLGELKANLKEQYGGYNADDEGLYDTYTENSGNSDRQGEWNTWLDKQLKDPDPKALPPGASK